MLQYLIVYNLVILSAFVVDSQCPNFTQFTGESTNQISLSYQINSTPTTPSISVLTTFFQLGNVLTNGFDVCPNEEFSIQFTPNGFTLDDIIISVSQFDYNNNNFINVSETVTSNFTQYYCTSSSGSPNPMYPLSGFPISVFRIPAGSNITNGVTATFSYGEYTLAAIFLEVTFRSQGETLYTRGIRNSNNDRVQLVVYQGSELVGRPSIQLPFSEQPVPEPRNCFSTTTVTTTTVTTTSVTTSTPTDSSKTILSSFYYIAGLLFVTLLFYSF